MRSRLALLLVLCVAAVAVAAPPSASASGGPSAGVDAAPPAETTTVATGRPADELEFGVVALYEDDGELVREVAIAPADVASVGAVETDTRTGDPYVPVTLTDRGAENFTETVLAAGFGDGATCRYEERPEDPGECLLTIADGEVVSSFGMAPELGRSVQSGAFAENPEFVLTADNESQAERIRAALSDAATTPATTTPAGGTTTGPDDGGPTPGFGAPLAVAAAVLALLALARRGGR